jgi:hypothetical protein
MVSNIIDPIAKEKTPKNNANNIFSIIGFLDSTLTE